MGEAPWGKKKGKTTFLVIENINYSRAKNAKLTRGIESAGQ
jgi:hypothetical protein